MQSKMFWYLVLVAQNTDKILVASIIVVHLVRNPFLSVEFSHLEKIL